MRERSRGMPWAALVGLLGSMSLMASASYASSFVDIRSEEEVLLLFWDPSILCTELQPNESSLETYLKRRGTLERVPIDGPVWGFTANDVWCELKLRNATPGDKHLRLEARYAFYDLIEVFLSKEDSDWDKILSAGDDRPFHQRPITSTGFVAPFSLAEGEQGSLIVSMRSVELTATPFIVLGIERHHRLSENFRLAYGIVYGGALLLALFHLVLFFFTRNFGYLFFTAFVVVLTLFLASYRGLGFELIWPNSVVWHQLSLPVFGGLTQLAFLGLAASFVPFRKLSSAWRNSAIFIGSLQPILIAYSVVNYSEFSYIASGVTAFFTGTWIICIVVRAWRMSRAVKFFGTAISVMVLGSLIDAGRGLSISSVENMFAPEHGKLGFDLILFIWQHPSELALLFGDIIIAAGLADQINVLRSDRERLRKEALDAALVSQEKLKSEVERQTLELKESRDRLLKIDEEKTAFFRMVSHELRTPLTLLQLPLERLEEEMGENSSLDMARRNAMRLQRLVNQLLDLQKSEVGRREEPLIRIEVHPFLATAGLYFAEAALAKGVHFELRRDGAVIDPSADYGEPLYMHADIDGLEKIVFNYLANALKFTDAGGTIALGYRSLDSGEIRIEVTDTGVGITDQDIKRLFSAFTQLDDSAARKVEGTGLGLALCKQLAEYMGGQVGVSSVVGEGSTFYLDVPEIEVGTDVESLDWAPREWLMAEHQQRRGELRSDDGSGLSTVDGGGKRVLVVDDLPDMRSLLGSLLEANGYTVLEASDGQQALTLASRQSLDLMITDWMMPEMSGPELIASIRELPEKQGIPIILLTANADERARIEGVDTGADAFLSKPFQNRELLATVRNLLSLKVREGELENLVIELRQTQEQLVAQSRMATLGELASGLAHEIRNPMNLAQGGVEEITEALKEPERDTAFDQQIEGLVSLIQRGIDRIESVIGRLHRLSQVRKSKVGGSSDLAAVVEDLRSFLNLSEAGRGALVQVEIPEGIEVGLDSGALNQVLLNLSLNAIQAGGKDVTLQLTYMPHEREDLAGLLRVSDNGPGIPEEVGERIFEPFYTGRAEGTGLGLPLCRTIVREAGGRLWLDADYKDGASFCIELPRPTDDDSLKVRAVASETSSSA